MFCLIQDDDGHWYVIPSDRQSDFNTWIDSEDADAGIVPDWAKRVNGAPNRVVFRSYEIR